MRKIRSREKDGDVGRELEEIRKRREFSPFEALRGERVTFSFYQSHVRARIGKT